MRENMEKIDFYVWSPQGGAKSAKYWRITTSETENKATTVHRSELSDK